MASKKSLSDLLREEVSKGPESQPLSPGTAQDEAALAHSPTTEEVSMGPSTSTRSRQTTKTTPSRSGTGSRPKSLSRLTKAELESKVNHLTESLQTSREQETTLKQQINQLEATIAEKNDSIQTLQAALAKTQPLQADLKLAKEDALKLAQENTRLQTQVERLRQEHDELKARLKRSPGTPTVSAPKSSARRAQPHAPASRRVVSSRSILERPIKPSPTMRKPQKSSKNFETWCYD